MSYDEASQILTRDGFQRCIRSRLPRGVTVEDVLGRTWERWSRARNKPLVRDLPRWLFRVAVNIAKDDAKAESRRKRRRMHHDEHRQPECGHDGDDLHREQTHFEPCYHSNPSAALDRSEHRRVIASAVRAAGIPRNHRCALWAWMRDRLDEWAARHHVKRTTARVWAKRARDALKPYLVAAGLGHQ